MTPRYNPEFMTKTAIFPGTFNPFTIGHADIVRRGLSLFDHIIIAIGFNPDKHDSADSACKRASDLARLYADEPRVSVKAYSGLTVDFARAKDAPFILRAVRDTRDFEYERNLADINRKIAGIETLFLCASPDLAWLSSSAVRELASHGYDITPFLPTPDTI